MECELKMNTPKELGRGGRQNETLVTRIAVGLTVTLILIGLFSASRHRGSFFVTKDKRGQRLLDSEKPEAAAKAFADPRWRGVAYFRAGQFEQAASTFAGLPDAEAAFNHGNSLVMQGKYEDAVKRYDRALQIRPGWGPAEANRAIALGRAERVKREGGEGTGGQLGADEIVFSDNKSTEGGTETVEQDSMSDEELRGVWLRQVQTTPSQFLRAKFAYQLATNQRARQRDE